MALEGREILPLMAWIFVLGVSIYITSKTIGKVNDKIGEAFK